MKYPITGTDDDWRPDLRYYSTTLELHVLMGEIQGGGRLTSAGTLLSDVIECINLAIF